ncbi:sigma-G-dependent sporulation-specific SASP protein [Ornithinibacillus bavariensis]|uniref:Sigma-G-dependent sporulation-specific SASP protein n=1 Tax=Ornithinibacillus bavariensis TaxID=545502 RepID=A0A919X6S5_9BACI|nr:sigma-G-dependent sporulation-specific SASP protein [Ornithinibacillus bavariensis]
MSIIDHTLMYLRESLSNYENNELSQSIYNKLVHNSYSSEADFVEDLNDKEMQYLNHILEREIHYAENVQDDLRIQQLREVYELIF